MQNSKKTPLKGLANKGEESARRTTIILEKKEREYVDSLILEGKELGIKPLISKMLDIHKNMMVYDTANAQRKTAGNRQNHGSRIESFNGNHFGHQINSA
jgi:pantothenate kinase-related protein Tda10